MDEPFVHPYIANSVPEIKKVMLKEIGVEDVEKIYIDIPEEFKMKRSLNIPSSKSEYDVKRSIGTIMGKNKTRDEMLCFLGAGCWPHHVPAVCDEINGRSEFLTAYAGDTYSDQGRHQALFEFQSMIGELVGMDFVTSSMYDWSTVCGEAARMASRITGRYEFLVPKTMSPDRLSVLRIYSEHLMDIKQIGHDPFTGQLDLEDLKSQISSKTAGVYIENPTYLGYVEAQGKEIAEIAHDHGALSVVGVEPISLGLLTPPGDYDADIVVGEGQPLGMHMSFGGALLGIIACQDDVRLVSEMPKVMLSITKTAQEGEWGFLNIYPERSWHIARERGKTHTGTPSNLWAITAAVYLALLGPKGLRELAESIMKRSNYAMKLISDVEGVKTPLFNSTHFMEFTVNFNGTGKTVTEINKSLLERGIQGGKDISGEFPHIGENALYCVTEVHSKEDIENLYGALKEVC